MPIGAFEGRTDLLVEKSDLDRLREINQTFPKTRFDELPIKRDVYAGDDEYCPAGTEFMGINSEGEVFPCNFLQFSLGNIRHKSLRTMRAQLLQSNWFCKKHPVCLCGEDKEFINTYIVPNKGNEKPIDAIKAFNLTDL